MKKPNLLKRNIVYLLVGLTTQSYAASSTNLVDPTRPPAAFIKPSAILTLSAGPMKLSAVFIHGDQRRAFIDDQMASIGDKIGAYTIINIQRDTVELKGTQEDSLVLSLLPTVKKASGINQGN